MGNDNKTSTRRKFLGATGTAAGSALIAGCSGNSSQKTQSSTNESESKKPQKGGTLQLTIGKLDSLDPVKSVQANSYGVRNQIMDGLVMDLNGDLSVQGVLAKKHSVSDDGKTYTFHLKKGVKYHNGDKFKAKDYVYVFERIASSSNTSWAYMVLQELGVKHETDSDGNYKPGTLATEAPDDHTFKFTLKEPYYGTMGVISYQVFAAEPEGIVGDVKGYDGKMKEGKYGTHPIGCGPFKFKKWSSGTEVAVERFDDYHGDVPLLDGVHWKVLADSNASYNYNMNKNADIITIPNSHYDSSKITIKNKNGKQGRKTGTYGPLRNGLTVNYATVPGMNPTYLVFNTNKVPKKVRKAFVYVLNQQQIAQNAYKGRASPAAFMMPPSAYPGGPDAEAKAAQDYPYDYKSNNFAKAKQLMKEAGYGPNNKYKMQFDGWQTDAAKSMGQLLQSQLASVYIDLNVQISPSSTYWSRASKGNFDVYLSGWGMTAKDPSGLLTVVVPSHTIIGSGSAIEYADWKGTAAAKRANNDWDTIQNNGKPTSAGKKTRSQAFIDIEKANWEDVAFVPIVYNKVEQFWYDWADVPLLGPVGEAYYRFNHATIKQGGKRPS